MNFSTVDVERIFPVAGVFDDVIINKKGAITIGWEVTWPEAFSCNEQDYDTVMENLASALKVLPPWTVYHKQDMFTYDTYKAAPSKLFLEGEYERHFAGRRYLKHTSYLFLTHASRNLVEQQGKSSGLFGLRGRVAVPSLSEFDAWRNKCDEFISILTNGGAVKVRLLHEEDWLGKDDRVGIVQKYMMLGNESNVMSNIAMSPDGISVYDKAAVAYVVAESDYLPTSIASVSKVSELSNPGVSEVFLSYGAKLGILLGCEHVVNQYIVIPQQDEVLRNLDKEKDKMIGGISSVDNRLNAGEIQTFLDAAYKEGKLAVKTHLNVIGWGDAAECQTLSSRLSTAITSMNITSVYNNYNTPVLYYAGIPGMGTDIGKENLMTQELYSTLCLGFYETFQRNIEGGTFKICDRLRNVPIVLDLQNTARSLGLINNFNTFILGGSGTGKSFFTNQLLRQVYDRGGDVFLIDVGDSYEGLANIINEQSHGADGIYMSWDNDHPLTFDIFLGYENWLTSDGMLRTDDESSNFLLTLLQTIWVPDAGWTTERKTILNQIVTQFVRQIGEMGRKPVFDDFYRYVDTVVAPKIAYVSPWEKTTIEAGDTAAAAKLVEDKDADYRANGYWCGSVLVNTARFDASSFVMSLKEYSRDGIYSSIFNDPDPKDVLGSRFTVVEVDKLSQQDVKYYSVCILAIMNAFDIKMRKNNRFKTMVIEEAWKAISNETMAPYLAGLWKTARKFNCAATVVTQEIADIINNPTIKTAILDNSDVKILLDQSNHLNTFDALQRVLSLTDKDKQIILSMNRNLNRDYKYKEVYLNLGGKVSTVMATEVSPAEAIAYESAKDKKKKFIDLAREKGSYIEAIKILTR